MLRTAAARYMRQHSDDFIPFLPDLGSDPEEVQEAFARYCDRMENTSAWGGQPEILAISHVFHTPIHVLQPGMPLVRIGDEAYPDKRPLLISYHTKLYGLGEHYNSLHPVSA